VPRWPIDRWALTSFRRLLTRNLELMDAVDFFHARQELEQFFWGTFCDNYLELAKARLYDQQESARAARLSGQATLYELLLGQLRLFAPFIPHITEEIYQIASLPRDRGESLHTGGYPDPAQFLDDAANHQRAQQAVQILGLVRRFRAAKSLSMKVEIPPWRSSVSTSTSRASPTSARTCSRPRACSRSCRRRARRSKATSSPRARFASGARRRLRRRRTRSRSSRSRGRRRVRSSFTSDAGVCSRPSVRRSGLGEPEVAMAQGDPAAQSRQAFPRLLGDFELLRELGRGGMAVVYLARERSLDRIVALKILPLDRSASARDIERFHREATLVARLRHPHVVPIHQVGEVQGSHYIAMDYVAGPSFAELLHGVHDRAPAEVTQEAVPVAGVLRSQAGAARLVRRRRVPIGGGDRIPRSRTRTSRASFTAT
jgi:hypothetical protein